MRQCTWKDPDSPRCENAATHPQTREDGSEWANLCQTHEDKLTECMATDEPKYLLMSWVRASGGAAKMMGKENL